MIDHETARLPSSARTPRFDVTNLQGCAGQRLVGLASRLFSLGSAKGDIEFR